MRCSTTRLDNSKQLYADITEITPVQCSQFLVKGKPLKNFPRCKEFSQIFDNYLDDAIEYSSSYPLNESVIDSNTHKDNFVYLHIIHKFPIKVLKVLFENVKADCDGKDDDSDYDDDDDEEEEEEESGNLPQEGKAFDQRKTMQ